MKIILNHVEKPELQIMIAATAQRITETLRELVWTMVPAEAGSDDIAEEMNLPLPKPYYKRSNKGAAHTFLIQDMIKRARSEHQRTRNSDVRREQLTRDNMVRSMLTLQSSRASHNRSLGLMMLNSQEDQDQAIKRERSASRIAEFSQILDL